MAISTEALASSSARHPWFVLGVWAIVLVGAVVAISTLLSDALTTEVRLTNNPDSERADALLKEWRGDDHSNEVVVIASDSLTTDDAAFQSKVEEITGLVNGVGPDKVLGATNFYESGDSALISADKHVALVPTRWRAMTLTRQTTSDPCLTRWVTHAVTATSRFCLVAERASTKTCR